MIRAFKNNLGQRLAARRLRLGPRIIQTDFSGCSMLVRPHEDVGRNMVLGQFETADLMHFIGALRANDLVFDVGANLGAYCIPVGKAHPNVKVCAFEPIELNAALIQVSSLLNRLTNVTIVRKCVSDRSGFVEFSLAEDSAYSSMVDTGRKAEVERLLCESTSVDDFCASQGGFSPNVMKIDVEGAELKVLSGASRLFSDDATKPRLVLIELYDQNLSVFWDHDQRGRRPHVAVALPSVRPYRGFPRALCARAPQQPLQRLFRVVSDHAQAAATGEIAATSEAIERCFVCSSSLRRGARLFDDRYGYPGRYDVLSCVACGHRMLDAHLDAAQLTDLYTRYYPRSGFDVDAWCPPSEESRWRTWWRGLRSSAFRWVPRNVRVLDIGCGFGEALGYHRTRGCHAKGVEADRNILRVAERHGLDVDAGLFDASNYKPESFDVVTLDQVIEHVASPITLLEGIREVLTPEGTLIVSTPNPDGWGAALFGRRWIHWHAPYHVQFFSRRSMFQLARRIGFRIERTATITNSAWLDFQWGHLATYPDPGAPSAYWNVSQPRTLLQRIVLKVLLVADRLGLNTAVTRLMDTAGWGDNVVYVLKKVG
jgi:FkbM family methyltransferase